jgi:hypothetical protein
MKMTCNAKFYYHKEADAEAARQGTLAKHPKDPRNKYLRVYVCQRCGLFHVGHQKSKYVPKLLAAPKQKGPKQPTPGQQRRAARKEAERAARQLQFADYIENLNIAKILIDRELSRYATLGIKPRVVSAALTAADMDIHTERPLTRRSTDRENLPSQTKAGGY